MPTPAGPTSTRDDRLSGRDRFFLAFLSAAAVALGPRGILRFSYVGQDFVQHQALTPLFPREMFGYCLRFMNPPALCFLVLNVSVLWLLYGFPW
jgi:hypothetical protein